MQELIDKAQVLQRLCAACSNMGSFACISCAIPRIVKETSAINAPSATVLRRNIMDDYDRVEECLQGLQILFDSAAELPEYICSSENYPIDKTTVLSDIKLSSFNFIIGEAISILEHGIKNHGNIV